LLPLAKLSLSSDTSFICVSTIAVGRCEGKRHVTSTTHVRSAPFLLTKQLPVFLRYHGNAPMDRIYEMVAEGCERCSTAWPHIQLPRHLTLADNCATPLIKRKISEADRFALQRTCWPRWRRLESGHLRPLHRRHPRRSCPMSANRGRDVDRHFRSPRYLTCASNNLSLPPFEHTFMRKTENRQIR
jgi:hypothetical protein